MSPVRIGVLGAGFGLYGYLPAAIENGWEVHTLKRYMSAIAERTELSPFLKDISFSSNETSLLKEVDCLVNARHPESQSDLIDSTQNFSGHLFLEKPLGATIGLHEQILEHLVHRNSHFSLGYLFAFTVWYNEVVTWWMSSDIVCVRINWHIQRPESAWKQNSSVGGGIANYYAVHFIPLFLDLSLSIDDAHIQYDSFGGLTIKGTLANKTLELRVSFETISFFDLEISNGENVVYSRNTFASPFGELPAPGKRDSRINAISKYLLANFETLDSTHDIAIEMEVLKFRNRTK